MKIVAIVPATDAPETLSRCTDALLAAQEAPDVVLVVDDRSITGPARARNVGAESAKCDVLVFVDSDVEVHRDAFVRIRKAFAADEGLTAVFGSYDDDPERHGLVSDFRNLLHHHVHHEGAGPATTFWAGLGAVRRDAFLAVNGFDEKRFPNASIEDIDLGMRLAANGGRIVLDPRIQGKHLKRWTLTSMIETDLFRRGVPWVRLLAANKTTSGALNLSLRHRVSAGASLGLAASLAARRGRPALLCLGVLAGLNRDFYALLLRQRGWKQVAVGLPLHVTHHLTGAAAIPLAAAANARERIARAHARKATAQPREKS